MALNKSRMRSELADTAHLKRLLNKIKTMHLVFEVGATRFRAQDCANVAIDETLSSDNIQFRRPPGVAIKAYLDVQALHYAAKTAGTGGNAISIEYLNTGTAGSEVVTVTTNKISVQIQAGVSTAAQIKAAVEASGSAAALVDITLNSAASATQAAFTNTNLAHGAAAPALEKYDLADIRMIKRLRTKKWLIAINGNANPA